LHQSTMVHIFQKKRFLVDYLSNFVDMHNHILPGIDDGAANPEEAINLLKGFGELGISRFIATPHIMTNLYPNTRATIQASLQVLENALLEEGIKNISIEVAAEHMIDDDFIGKISNAEELSIRDNYLLVEMSYLQPPLNFQEAIIKVASKGYYPVLAHPERYMFLHRRLHKYKQYKERGILLQLNLLSLGDYYGKEVQKIAFKLLDDGLIDFIASDIHNERQLDTLKELRIPERKLRQVLPIIGSTIETFY